MRKATTEDAGCGFGSPGPAPRLLLDVDVLVTAMREDAPRHREVKAFVEGLRRAPEPFGLSDLVLCGTLRVPTHPRLFAPPTPPETARAYVAALRGTPNAVVVAPGLVVQPSIL